MGSLGIPGLRVASGKGTLSSLEGSDCLPGSSALNVLRDLG